MTKADEPATSARAQLLPGVETFFLHLRLVDKLLTSSPIGPEDITGATGIHRTALINRVERELARTFTVSPPPDLSVGWLTNRAALRVGEIVAVDQVMTVSGLASALRALRAGKAARASFRGTMFTDSEVEFCGTFNVEHLTSNSAPDLLSGKRGLFLVGYITAINASVELRPILIGQRLFHHGHTSPLLPNNSLELHPSQVDAFAAAFVASREELQLTPTDLNRLKTISEKAVKEAIARIIGEPDVPKDWGGEQSDLWTSRLRVGGTYFSAAFLFKGPAKFAPMTIRMLGANGDQIARLANEPADVLVVQHCHSVKSEVRRMLRAYAQLDWNRPRRYMVIDGYDTIRILRQYDVL